MSAANARLALALDRDQARLLMAGLGELPFRTVCALVERLNQWAVQAAAGEGADVLAQPFVLDIAELELVLHALGGLPYRSVYVLIGSLQQQLDQVRRQLRAVAAPSHPGAEVAHG